MKYKIRDIAEILNLSKQMIRYYEQNGVIHPKRMKENNYRIYDEKDYFALTEAIGLSRFNIYIRDIHSLKGNDYCTEVCKCYKKYINEVNEEIIYKNLLKKRAEELLVRTENTEMNIGHSWIKKRSAHRLYPLVKSRDDHYGQIEIPLEVRSILNSAEVMPFGDVVVELNDDYDQWWISFDQSYVEGLKLPECKESIEVKEQYCLCLIINMGNIGEFKSEMVQKNLKELYKMNYKIIDKPRSLLLYRGAKDNQFHRPLEIQVPIQKP